MSTTTFQSNAIQWLRDEAGLATEVRPSDRIPDPDAPMVVEGWLNRPSRAGTYAYASLWVLTGAVLLSMLGLPGMSETAEALLHRAGQVGLMAAGGLLLLAWVVSRRHRDPVLVQIHPSAAPPTAAAVADLLRRAHGAAVWIVVQQTPSAEVLAAAERDGVRWFARTAGGFAPLAAQSSSRSSSTTG